jgi:catechol 2,3-dioxygenase-like lactoylglutathione lyase family enzyme
MKVEVIGLDHLYVTVRSLSASEAFYDPIMRFLDFRKGTVPVGGDPHVHYYNRVLQYTIRPAHSDASHDPYAAGLHHVCFRVRGRAEVDAAGHFLRELGVSATEPGIVPGYDSDYYATFFEDPDGIRLEIVAEVERRRLIRDHWSELTEFENPLSKAGLWPRKASPS